MVFDLTQKVFAIALFNDYCFYNDICELDCNTHYDKYSTYLEFSFKVIELVDLNYTAQSAVIEALADVNLMIFESTPLEHIVNRLQQITTDVTQIKPETYENF